MVNPFTSIEESLNDIKGLLLDLSQKNPKEQEQKKESDELLTVQGAAKFLSLSPTTIYTLISRGDIPVMKRSKRCYFSKFELIEYLKIGRKKTNTEKTAEVNDFLKNKKGSSHE